MSVYFTSDLHFGHRMVAGLRGFASPEEHDEAIIENWRRTVHKSATVWVLGDLTLENPARALSIIKDLPGTKHFIAGNHDRCHPMQRNAARFQREYLSAFETVQPFGWQRWEGMRWALSHFPYERDRDETRHQQWRLPNRGHWLLHGHTHGNERTTVGWTNGGLLRSREIHVGLDAWGLTPASLEQVIAEREWGEKWLTD